MEPKDEDLPEALVSARDKLMMVATGVAKMQLGHGLQIDVKEYVKETVNPRMMQVVYEWARGTSFADICQLTDVLEGSIVRCITRLDETCRDVRNAARVIGDPKLYQDMIAASELIKRDIVFAASLYVV